MKDSKQILEDLTRITSKRFAKCRDENEITEAFSNCSLVNERLFDKFTAGQLQVKSQCLVLKNETLLDTSICSKTRPVADKGFERFQNWVEDSLRSWRFFLGGETKLIGKWRVIARLENCYFFF